MGHTVCTEVEDEERKKECKRKGQGNAVSGDMQSLQTQPITHKPMLSTGKHRSDKRQRKVHDGM